MTSKPNDKDRDEAPRIGSGYRDWEWAAHRLGEMMCADGPKGYYLFTPQQLVDWASSLPSRTVPETGSSIQHDMAAILQTACDADEADPRALLSEIAKIASKHPWPTTPRSTIQPSLGEQVAWVATDPGGGRVLFWKHTFDAEWVAEHYPNAEPLYALSATGRA